MNKQSFWGLVDLIDQDPVFFNRSNVQQRPVCVQLLVALQRFGCHGNGVSVRRLVAFFAIAGDGTHLYRIAIVDDEELTTCNNSCRGYSHRILQPSDHGPMQPSKYTPCLARRKKTEGDFGQDSQQEPIPPMHRIRRRLYLPHRIQTGAR